MLHQCPGCGGRRFHLSVPVHEILRESAVRNGFVRHRLEYKPEPGELKDLTDFMHSGAAALFVCSRCGTLVRAEPDSGAAAAYEQDENDAAVMRQLMPRFVEAFRNKEEAYRGRLRPGADVLEIGSHLGAFLQAAEEWSWNPVGLDVGKDTAEFARYRGFAVRRGVIEEQPFGAQRFDAVFVWNCFDQIPQPDQTLDEIHRALKPHGLLVIRVPNARFYRELRTLTGHSRFAMHALAYNNLLGFPYLYGYTAESLTALLGRRGFALVRGFNSELVTMPFAEPSRQVAAEQLRISGEVGWWSTATTHREGVLTGPWMEAIFRRLDHPETAAAAAGRKLDSRFLKRAA